MVPGTGCLFVEPLAWGVKYWMELLLNREPGVILWGEGNWEGVDLLRAGAFWDDGEASTPFSCSADTCWAPQAYTVLATPGLAERRAAGLGGPLHCRLSHPILGSA